MIKAIASDPYADEPTVTFDKEAWEAYLAARREAQYWGQTLENLKNELILALGDAHAGLVEGRKVVTFRPQKRWAAAQLRQRHPELTEQFMVPRMTYEFNMEAFAKVHPDIAEQFRVRAFDLTEAGREGL